LHAAPSLLNLAPAATPRARAVRAVRVRARTHTHAHAHSRTHLDIGLAPLRLHTRPAPTGKASRARRAAPCLGPAGARRDPATLPRSGAPPLLIEAGALNTHEPKVKKKVRVPHEENSAGMATRREEMRRVPVGGGGLGAPGGVRRDGTLRAAHCLSARDWLAGVRGVVVPATESRCHVRGASERGQAEGLASPHQEADVEEADVAALSGDGCGRVPSPETAELLRPPPPARDAASPCCVSGDQDRGRGV